MDSEWTNWTEEDSEALKSWANKIDSDDIMIKQKIMVELSKNKQILHLLHSKELEQEVDEDSIKTSSNVTGKSTKSRKKKKQNEEDNEYDDECDIDDNSSEDKEISVIEATDYSGKCILPYYTIEPTQTNVKNFICFETQWEEEPNYSRNVYNYTNRKKLRQFKLQQIIFHILCHVADITVEEAGGIPRHDLLAALITNQFNWTNMFGKKIHVVSSKPSTVDNKFVTRTLVFEQFTDNELVKTNDDGVPRLANKDIVTGTEDPDDD